jgi:hypothetical protein
MSDMTNVWLKRGIVRRALLVETESPLARILLAQFRQEEAEVLLGHRP